MRCCTRPKTTVLFSCMSSGGGASIRLVYDYRLGRWSKDILLDGCPIISMAVPRYGVCAYLQLRGQC